jgi:hypothetical protein
MNLLLIPFSHTNSPTQEHILFHNEVFGTQMLWIEIRKRWLNPLGVCPRAWEAPIAMINEAWAVKLNLGFKGGE